MTPGPRRVVARAGSRSLNTAPSSRTLRVCPPSPPLHRRPQVTADRCVLYRSSLVLSPPTAPYPYAVLIDCRSRRSSPASLVSTTELDGLAHGRLEPAPRAGRARSLRPRGPGGRSEQPCWHLWLPDERQLHRRCYQQCVRRRHRMRCGPGASRWRSDSADSQLSPQYGYCGVSCSRSRRADPPVHRRQVRRAYASIACATDSRSLCTNATLGRAATACVGASSATAVRTGGRSFADVSRLRCESRLRLPWRAPMRL